MTTKAGKSFICTARAELTAGAQSPEAGAAPGRANVTLESEGLQAAVEK